MGYSLFILADQTILENKQELKDLETKLGIIISIVQKYMKDGGADAITHRIEDFSKCVASSCLFWSLLMFSDASQGNHCPIERG
jgi:hypothetical protein